MSKKTARQIRAHSDVNADQDIPKRLTPPYETDPPSDSELRSSDIPEFPDFLEFWARPPKAAENFGIFRPYPMRLFPSDPHETVPIRPP